MANMVYCLQKLCSAAKNGVLQRRFNRGQMTIMMRHHQHLKCIPWQKVTLLNNKTFNLFKELNSFTQNGSKYCSSFPRHFLKLQMRYASSNNSVDSSESKESIFSKESENEYFHSYLEGSPEYQPYLLSHQPRKQAAVLSSDSVAKFLQEMRRSRNVHKLVSVSEHWSAVSNFEGRCVLTDKNFGRTVHLLLDYAHQMSIKELMECMVNLSSLGFRQSESSFNNSKGRRNRINASRAFDEVFSKSVQQLEVKELLLVADFFYSVIGSSFTQYPISMCERMNHLLPSLTKTELILLLFHVSMMRRTSPLLIGGMLDILKHEMASLTLQELAIVNLAFFKSKLPLHHPSFFKAVADQLDKEAGLTVHPICFSALTKYHFKDFIFSQRQMPQFFTAMKTIEAPVLSRVSKLPSQTMIHVLNLYYEMDILSEDLFMAVLDRVINDGVRDWRVKDMAKVTQVLANVPLGAEKKIEALTTILSEVHTAERLQELRKYPECMLQMAVALSFCGIYPHWLTEFVFGDEAQKNFKESKINYSWDLYHLSESLNIEDGTYTGPLLWTSNFPKLDKSKIYNKLKSGRKDAGQAVNGSGQVSSNQVGKKKKKLFSRDLLLLALMDALAAARPEVTTEPAFLLSHFQNPDLEMSLTQDQDINRISSRSTISDLDDFVSEAVVVHSNNAYQMIRHIDGNTVPMLLQSHALRARQLRKLGTTVIEVPYFEIKKSKNWSQYLLDKFKKEEERILGVELH